jgi:hypothetical protein
MNDETVEFEEMLPDGHMAAIAAFRNSSSVPAKNVTATIDFQSGINSQLVMHGCWLNNRFSTQWIKPGQTAQLFIAAYVMDEDKYYTADCQKHEVNNANEPPIFRWLDKTVHTVKVTLNVKGVDQVYNFELSLVTGDFRFKSLDGTLSSV